MSTVFEIKNVLRKARKLVKDGWTQGMWDTGGGCYCASGAIRRASGFHTGMRDMMLCRDESKKSLSFEAEDYFSSSTGINNIITWNDSPLRTPEQVVAAFDKAIAKKVQA